MSRLLVEPLIARLAAMRATSSEIENMRRLLEKSEAARDVKAWELWDGTLHRAVAQPAHNQLLLAIFDAVNAMRSQAAWSRLRLVALSPRRLNVYRRQHRDYVGAIVWLAGDSSLLISPKLPSSNWSPNLRSASSRGSAVIDSEQAANRTEPA